MHLGTLAQRVGQELSQAEAVTATRTQHHDHAYGAYEQELDQLQSRAILRNVTGDGLDPWRAVLGGERLSWDTLTGASDAPWASPRGRELLQQIREDFTRLLGADWPADTYALGATGPYSHLAAACPTLNLQGPVAGFPLLVRLWISLVHTSALPGHDSVIKTLRTDLKPAPFRHAITQLELAALLSAADMEVALERELKGPPVDVSFTADDRDSGSVEVYTLGRDDVTTSYLDQHDRNLAHLSNLGRRYRVYWSGDVPATLSEAELAIWMQQTETVAVRARLLGQSEAITRPGERLVVTPGNEPVGNKLSGPPLSLDAGRRIFYLTYKKAVQARRSGATVLWLEDCGAMSLLFSYERLDLGQKLAALKTLFSPLLAEQPHIRSIVISRQGNGGTAPATDTRTHDSCSMYRQLTTPRRLREAALIRRPGSGPDPSIEKLLTAERELWGRLFRATTGLSDWADLPR